MKVVKLIVIGTFALLGVAFIAYRPISVTGQTGVTSLDAPTNVEATDNIYNNKVGIYWNAIRGATSYRIFKNTVNDPNTASDVGFAALNFFFDVSAIPGQTAFYWVRAENATRP